MKLNRICACCFLSMMVLVTATMAYPAEVSASDKTFLWRVQGRSGTIHLFGSVHLAKPDSYPLPRQVEETFMNAEVLALEADPGAAMGEEMQRKLVLSALYPKGDTLRQHLSRSAYEKAARETERLGLSIEQFARSKPWFVAMTISVLELQQLGYTPEHGIDRYFADRARGEKKIIELESFASQINLLNSLSDREQEFFLLYTVEEMASIREETEEMMRAWRTGDVKSMERIVSGAIDAYPEARPIYAKLYFQRNRMMAGRIEQLLQSGEKTFVVVGAAHLVGQEGIIELLKRRGYRVEQM